MANLVSTSNFSGLAFIDTSNSLVSSHIISIISEKEAQLISEIFGSENVEDIYSKLQNENISNQLIIFRDGGSFQFDGKQFRTKGLIYVLTRFLYRFIQEDKFSNDTPTGNVKLTNDNSQNVTPFVKICANWNNATEELEILYFFVKANLSEFKNEEITVKSLGYINQIGI